MRSTFSSLALFASIASASYVVVDDYTPTNFASMFDFYSGTDPTNGYVNYVDYDVASTYGLYKVENGQVYMGVDNTNVATGRGRSSIRISSKKSYNHGLIVLDLEHMPDSTCGSWPAFWTLGATQTWPNGGEVDIIEGVNTQNYNSMAMHTSDDCSVTNSGGFSGTLETDNCYISAAGQGSNVGCSVHTGNTQSYGTGFNQVGGGIYATLWTSEAISIYFFPRSAIPSDLSSGNPNPDNWGLPMAQFAGSCDLDSKIFDQQILFDITFCGDWAGGVWSTDTVCAPKASTCQDYVMNNPTAFKDTYWAINSLRVYQDNGAAVVSSSSSQAIASATSTSVAVSSVATTLTVVPVTSAIPTTVVTATSSAIIHTTPIVATFTSSTYIQPSYTYSAVFPTTFATQAAATATAAAAAAASSDFSRGNNNFRGGNNGGGGHGPSLGRLARSLRALL